MLLGVFTAGSENRNDSENCNNYPETNHDKEYNCKFKVWKVHQHTALKSVIWKHVQQQWQYRTQNESPEMSNGGP